MSEFAEYPKAVGSHLALNAEHEAALIEQFYPKPKKAAPTPKVAADAADGDGDEDGKGDDAEGSGDGEGEGDTAAPKKRGRKPKEPKESA